MRAERRQDHEDARTGFEHWSRVPAPAQAVWDRITTPEGINDELWPVLRMTVPRALRGVTIADLEPGRRVCRSWFLLGGVLPVDFDDITLEVIDPPTSFREHSRMLTFADWVHEREVRAVTSTVSLVHDRVSWIGRGPVNRSRPMRRAQRAMLGALFRHRHRRLAAYFTARSGAPRR